MKAMMEVDPRTQMLVTLITSVAVFLADLSALPWIMLFMALYLFAQGIYKTTVQYLVLALLLYLLQGWIAGSSLEVLNYLNILTFLGLRFMPVLMSALSLSKVPSGKLIAALRTLRLPMGVLVTLAVSFRFPPVMRLEYEAIQVAAKLRGVSIASPKNWLRPFSTFEYTIVPLLMRSLKISDELAASATTKGIDDPGRKTSIYPIAFRLQDAVLPIIYIAWLFAICR
ncbi:energy-coupling factor transporter transmembrane protein EcfT [Paenibacillus sp. 79R4]|nr:energy-coupling factor transporter transmembrane protein EcfT [Paenibacillus sp. 79R4]